MSGYLVHGNTISDCWAGIKLGGGRRTIITNNTFVRTHSAIEVTTQATLLREVPRLILTDCLQLQFDNRGETWQKASCDPAQALSYPHSFYKELSADFKASKQWSIQFPYLEKIADDQPCVPVYNNISGNVHCKCDTWISATAKQIAEWNSTAEGNTNTTAC